QFDKGYLSPHFVTNPATMECVLEKPYILIFEKKVTSAKDLLPLLGKIAEQGASLLIIAEDIEGEALLEDIAIRTGGKAIMEELGIELEKVEIGDLGRAKKVSIDKDNTTIVE